MSQISTLKKVLSSIKEAIEDRKVIKTLPIKKEWQSLLKEMQEAKEARELAESKYDTAHKLFWATVEKDTENYGSMAYNHETDEIEVYED